MRKSLWAVTVVTVFVSLLMMACVAFAGKAEWSYGVPVNIGEGGSFTGDEAMITVKGTVDKIEKMYGSKDGLQMRLIAAEGGKWTVFLGPKWFIENQKIKFAKGDKVEVRGKKVGGSIIGSEISKGEWTMKIRNEEDGQAVWQCCFPYKERKD
ncbi:MAG: hypothetical protein K4571_08545 [Deltaproteobacteria bacterium]